MASIVERALSATRESRRIATRPAAAPSLARDIAALANSGGGAIVIRDEFDLAAITETFRAATDADFADLREEQGLVIIGEAMTPIVIDGVIYVRRGSKTVAATTADVSKMIDRRVTMVRNAWLSAVRHVVKSDVPAGATQPVRVVTDPRAPAFRLIDHDKTHPFRQKEVLSALRQRMPELHITPFDLLAVRKVHDVDARREFVHKPAFGSNQYSVQFVDWLQGQMASDEGFLGAAREEYQRRRRRAVTESA
jgi:hypothetical protein